MLFPQRPLADEPGAGETGDRNILDPNAGQIGDRDVAPAHSPPGAPGKDIAQEDARIAGNQVELANFRALTAGSVALAGLVNLNADFSGSFSPTPAGTQLQIAALNGSFSARNLQMDGRTLGDLTANVSTAAGAIRYTASSNFAGSSRR